MGDIIVSTVFLTLHRKICDFFINRMLCVVRFFILGCADCAICESSRGGGLTLKDVHTGTSMPERKG